MSGIDESEVCETFVEDESELSEISFENKIHYSSFVKNVDEPKRKLIYEDSM